MKLKLNKDNRVIASEIQRLIEAGGSIKKDYSLGSAGCLIGEFKDGDHKVPLKTTDEIKIRNITFELTNNDEAVKEIEI